MAIGRVYCHEGHSLFCLHVFHVFGDYNNCICGKETLRKQCSLFLFKTFKKSLKKAENRREASAVASVSSSINAIRCSAQWCQLLAEPGHDLWVSPARLAWAQSDGAQAGEALPCPALGSPWAPGSCSILTVGFTWCYLAFILLPFLAHKCSSFIQGKFLHSAFQIFFAYLPPLCETKWQLPILREFIPIPLLWLDSWMEKEKYFSLTVSCKRKSCLHTLSRLCPWAKARQNQVLV